MHASSPTPSLGAIPIPAGLQDNLDQVTRERMHGGFPKFGCTDFGRPRTEDCIRSRSKLRPPILGKLPYMCVYAF